MRETTIFAAFSVGGMAALFALLILPLAPFKPSHIIVVAVASVFIGCALIAARGGSVWFLRAAWTALLVGFFWSDPPGGLMEGGIIVIPLMLLIIVGFISSLFARDEIPDKERAE
jgi:hypothetical protein